MCVPPPGPAEFALVDALGASQTGDGFSYCCCLGLRWQQSGWCQSRPQTARPTPPLPFLSWTFGFSLETLSPPLRVAASPGPVGKVKPPVMEGELFGVLPSCWSSVPAPLHILFHGHVPGHHMSRKRAQLTSCAVYLEFLLSCWVLGFPFLSFELILLTTFPEGLPQTPGDKAQAP